MNKTMSRSDNGRGSRVYDDPFQMIENRVNHMFRGILDSAGTESGLTNYPVDVTEDDDQITIEAELPGFSSNEIDVNMEDGVLTIKAERADSADGNGKLKRHLHERRLTRFERAFSLPRTVDGSEVLANLDQGVLTLKLKKSEASKPRKISIQSGSL
ncbi:18 kDa heat shock protein [Rubripirellula tenax]|uniref:18 kDa heat shock protein n=1 Tax=Rubripirellula tenax TaxID=2528015 RepID=A0A5C6EJM8_9BACT|nr:Hsp20/alpha crystallin family protein [Rubripirellula tenax]TWU47489.1 18 kDa heat shock protein [Rubripirellula tenax]